MERWAIASLVFCSVAGIAGWVTHWAFPGDAMPPGLRECASICFRGNMYMRRYVGAPTVCECGNAPDKETLL